MNALSDSVGDGGHNQRADVMAVQTLLKARGANPGAADGVCGPRTIAAIRAFQAGFMARPDGLISPGGTTWKHLNGAAPAAAPAPSGKWSGDSAQWPQERKLQSMTALLQPKVRSVLAALTKAGFQPKIFYGWRSVEVQLKLVKAGHSKVRFSFHNAQQPDGTPNAYAADIIDARYAWSDKAQSSGFWKALGAEAKKQNLIWGGDWSSFRDWAHVQLVANGQLPRIKKESGL